MVLQRETAGLIATSPVSPHAQPVDGHPVEGHPSDALPTSTELSVFELPACRLVVRPLLEGDGPELEWHGGPDLRSFYQEQWRGHNRGELFAVVADLRGLPVGQAAIHWQGNPNLPNVPHVQSLRVIKPLQGMGIGSRLLEVCEQVSARKGHDKISISVAVGNAAAFALYQRRGYARVGEPYTDIWHYTDAMGRLLKVEEDVMDLLKQLPGSS